MAGPDAAVGKRDDSASVWPPLNSGGGDGASATGRMDRVRYQSRPKRDESEFETGGQVDQQEQRRPAT